MASSSFDPTELEAWNALGASDWDYSEAQLWFHSEVLHPAVEDALARVDGGCGHVLDFGCGRGHLARRLIDRGVDCAAYEPAPTLAASARERLRPAPVFTNPVDVPRDAYDCVVANLVLSATSRLDETLRLMAEVTRVGGHIVFSVPHPVFSLIHALHTTTVRTPSADDPAPELHGLGRYMQDTHETVTWAAGSISTTIRHRTVSQYVAAIGRAGLTLRYVDEPISRTLPREGGVRAIFAHVPPFMLFQIERTR